jgi:hypothetical protein
MALT